jgi:hypothetical protein
MAFPSCLIILLLSLNFIHKQWMNESLDDSPIGNHYSRLSYIHCASPSFKPSFEPSLKPCTSSTISQSSSALLFPSARFVVAGLELKAKFPSPRSRTWSSSYLSVEPDAELTKLIIDLIEGVVEHYGRCDGSDRQWLPLPVLARE